MRFEFGKNWAQFLDAGFDKRQVDIARQDLLDRLQLPDLCGKSFLDIGCGSGIHSLAALYSGATHIVSLDLDDKSVQTTKSLHNQVGSPEHWKIMQGSVLDTDFIYNLEAADIVYSWGVLHHTGAMWDALKNVALPLKENGVLYIALYASEMYQNPSPDFWVNIKRKYNSGTEEEKEELEYWFAWERTLKKRSLAGENPFIIMRDYKKNRGMEFWTDVRDWLGGYPMEFSLATEVAKFTSSQLDLEILDVKTGEGNTEYILRRRDSLNYWDKILSSYTTIQLENPFEHRKGHCFIASVPDLRPIADNDEQLYASPVLLFEDGILAGFPHAYHEPIEEKGEGRYSHWKEDILFSTSDNSNPNENGRVYSIRIPKEIS